MDERAFWIHPRILDAWDSGVKFVCAKGGRGGAKTLSFAGICVLLWALSACTPPHRILCVRGTQNTISESSLEALKTVIRMVGFESAFEITEHGLRCLNGSDFLFYGAKAYQRFPSLEGVDLVWIDEANQVSMAAWDVLIPTIRRAPARFLLSWNPRFKTDAVEKLFVQEQRPDAAVIHTNHDENPLFPETLRTLMEYDREHNIAKYNHIWCGGYDDAPVGALWQFSEIRVEPRQVDARTGKKPDLERVVVAVDPSGTSTASSDACGIVAAGRIGNKRYVLADESRIMSPLEWARTAVNLYHKFKADSIVYEANYGGDMVQTIIRQVDPGVPVHGVHVNRGKILRAEPVKALYEQGLVVHEAQFPDLEYEMTHYTGASNERSPNRLDAMVYAVSALEQGLQIKYDRRIW